MLWMRGSPEQFATWQQFKVLVRVIDVLHHMLQASHGAMHFRAGMKGTSTPKVTWTESHLDMPRRE